MTVIKEKKDVKSPGFIQLHRSVRDHWIWADPQKFQWWCDILMDCNHSDRKVNIGFELMDCKRGQSLNSLSTWARRWRCDVGIVRRFLKLLEKDKMIITENVKKTTRLTVCNYDSYNGGRQANDRQTTGKQIQSESSANTNNNDNNVNNDNKEIGAESNHDEEGVLDNNANTSQTKKRKRAPGAGQHHFRESPYFDKAKLQEGLNGTNYSEANIDYYHERANNWSESAEKNKKSNWLATLKNWMLSDQGKGEFRTKGTLNFKSNAKTTGKTIEPIRPEQRSAF